VVTQFLIAIDQLLNTLIGGFADETLSSHAWRMEQQGKPWGCLRGVIDGLFFWQVSHCRMSYMSEQLRNQCPPELRSTSIPPA